MSNNIAALYTQQMVPLGQMIELLHLLVNQSMRRQKHSVTIKAHRAPQTAKIIASALTGPILDTLHLVNLFLLARIHRDAPVDTSRLAGAFDDLINLMRSVLRDWSSLAMTNPDLEAAMNSVLRHPSQTPSLMSSQAKFMEAMAGQVNPAYRILTGIWSAIGYLPTTRNPWLMENLSQAKGQPLAKDGKANYWLTLVRNTSLDRTLALLDVQLCQRYLGSTSREGRQRLPQLLATLPGYLAVANKENLVGPNTTRIPDDVSLTVENGLLVLTCELPCLLTPVALAEPKEWGEFCTRHPDSLPAAEERSLQVTCGVETLAKGLQYLAQARSAQAVSAKKVLAKFETDKIAHRQAALVEKLTATFNEEEMQALAKYFGNKK